jgi:hypothetical protein
MTDAARPDGDPQPSPPHKTAASRSAPGHKAAQRTGEDDAYPNAQWNTFGPGWLLFSCTVPGF